MSSVLGPRGERWGPGQGTWKAVSRASVINMRPGCPNAIAGADADVRHPSRIGSPSRGRIAA